MAGDELQLFNGLAQHSGGPAGHILVGSTVEAVAADLILGIILIGQGVGVGHGRHGLMEGGVEHGYHGGAGHKGLAGLDPDDVGGIVERSQGVALLNGGHYLIGDEHALGKLLAAVNHTVAHCIDLLHRADHAVLRVHQSVEHGLDGLGVGGHGHVGLFDGLLAVRLVGKLAVNANTLAQALGQHLLRLGVEQLILQGRAAGVDDQNIHGNRLLHTSKFKHGRGLPWWVECNTIKARPVYDPIIQRFIKKDNHFSEKKEDIPSGGQPHAGDWNRCRI